MVYLILAYFIGFFVVSIVKRFHWSFEDFMDYNTAGILCTAAVIFIMFFTGGIKAEYETDTEYYRIKEIYEDQYFIENTETNEILVFLADETSWKIFPEEKTKIQSTKGQPTIKVKMKKAKEGHADQESVKKKEYLKQRQRGGKKLNSFKIYFLLTGIGISLFGIRNYIFNFKIDEEDRKYNSKAQMFVGLSLLALWAVLGV